MTIERPQGFDNSLVRPGDIVVVAAMHTIGGGQIICVKNKEHKYTVRAYSPDFGEDGGTVDTLDEATRLYAKKCNEVLKSVI